MILAAGRGARMRPLTDTVPKPLLAVGGRALIVRQIEALVAAGIDDLVVNHAWLGAQIEAALGDGRRFGARIAWSREGTALETAGGIATALPLLGDAPFVVVSADIHTDYDYRRLHPIADAIADDFDSHAVHLVLVDNPSWHPRGDMALVDGRIARHAADGATLTYANIAVFHPRAFDGVAAHRVQKLFPWAYRFADEGRMTGSVHRGTWDNIGDPAQLAALDARLSDG